jgi:ketosteroid isomerase-like protein
MSEKEVALARQYYDALNAQGSFEDTQHLRHPDIELLDPPDFPDAGRYFGEAALRERVESYMEVGWDGQYPVEEYLDAGEEVVVVWRVRGQSAHGGGVPLDRTFVHVCLFEGGKVRRIRQYLSRAEALEAVGLSK